MGTHPIFESDFDCLTDFRKGVKMAAFSDVEHPWSWLHREEIKCSSCPAQVNPFNVWYRHPVLKTIQCSECNKFYNQGEFTKDEDGYYMYCRLCGEGGSLYGCDYCIESFCKQCILRNLGRTAITEIEGGSKWKCYICCPEKFKEPRDRAQKIYDSVKLHDKYLEEKQLNSEKRKLEKFEKQKAKKMESVLVKTSGEKSETPDSEVKEEADLYSTDEEDIEKGILKLIEDLEKAIQDDSKPHDERRKYLKKIHKNRRKFTSLQGKARKVIAAAEGNHPDADLDVAEDFASEDENELELLGLKSSKKSKPKTKSSVKTESKPSKKKKKKSESDEETEQTPKGKSKKKFKLRLKKSSAKKKKLQSSSEESEAEASEPEDESDEDFTSD